ncbi:hypothetical protein QCA50_011420 [Cerrena zonata]|uniref:DUF6534 domain-containing protein n=1 Tax=Cerrena zonata TaxID=2478898 RepID=A0AAW0FVI4_9APHY
MSTFPSFSSIVGGFVEAISISNILFGVAVAQFYVYTQNWDRDPRWIKYLAINIIVFDAGYTASAQRAQYFYSVLAIGDPFLLLEVDWSIPVSVILGLFAEISVQGFYIHRMWIFSKNRPLVVTTTLLVAGRHGLFLNCIVDTIRFSTWPSLQAGRGFKPSVTSCTVLIICTDALIAITMAYYLYSRQSTLRKTQGILGWLMLYFVSTGGVLVAISVTMLICFLVAPNNLLWAGIIVLYARVLPNAFFGALNARQLLRNKQGEVITFGGVSIHGHTIATSIELCHATPGTTAAQESNVNLSDGNPNVKPASRLSSGV